MTTKQFLQFRDIQTQLSQEESPNRRRRLEFVHIPKTGGTMIGDAAAKQNITWGVCHYTTGGVCPKHRRTVYQQLPKPYYVSRWHVPPFYFFENESPDTHPYHDDADLFAIVRNPYDRFLSQYYFVMQLVHKKPANQTHDPKVLNAWAQRNLGIIAENNRTSIGYYIQDAHLVPQWDFVYDANGTQLIKYVLRYEHLNNDFGLLQRARGYITGLNAIELPRGDHDRFQATEKKFGLVNMTGATLDLIESVYKKDFEVFGYDKAERLPYQLTVSE